MILSKNASLDFIFVPPMLHRYSTKAAEVIRQSPFVKKNIAVRSSYKALLQTSKDCRCEDDDPIIPGPAAAGKDCTCEGDSNTAAGDCKVGGGVVDYPETTGVMNQLASG